MFKQNRFIIRVNGQDFPWPTGFNFSRSMMVMNASFDLTFIDPEQAIIRNFRPGTECEIIIDDVLLARVYLDSIGIDDSNGHVFTCRGRDRAGDLIDCSAKFSDGFERSNVSLEEAIKDILKPFKMDVKVDANTGERFKKLSINPGDTVFNFIEQHCKFRSILPLSDGVGGLILTKPALNRSPGVIEVGNNVMSRSGEINHFERFSNITVLGQADASDDANASAAALSKSKGQSKDPDITRHRPLIMQAEREGYTLSMNERAAWEVRHRRFAATALTYTAPGWQAAEGVFWTINTLVPVRDSELNISRDMLIKEVRLSRSEQGTTSAITVAPAESFDLPPMRESEDKDDAVWGGGA